MKLLPHGIADFDRIIKDDLYYIDKTRFVHLLEEWGSKVVTQLGEKKKMTPMLPENYPQAPIMFKEKVFVDFLGLPKRHSEPHLKKAYWNT